VREQQWQTARWRASFDIKSQRSGTVLAVGLYFAAALSFLALIDGLLTVEIATEHVMLWTPAP